MSTEPSAIYAIGDVHGCLSLLAALEQIIITDATPISGDKWLIMLGDLVDRGPDSAKVIDRRLSSPPAGFRRLCLRGNHEQMMLAFLLRPQANSPWLEFGGRETLVSYGIPEETLRRGAMNNRSIRTLVDAYVPGEHVAFLQGQPAMLETPGAVIVHAGIRPGVQLNAQRDGDLLWYRDDFADDYASVRKLVVHGHSLRPDPVLSQYRISVDTGAYLSGRLTAVRIVPGEVPKLLVAGGSAR